MNLTELKNIRGRTARWLRDIGIDSVERLAERDMFEVWTELKRIRPREVEDQLLLELEGAILNVDWQELPGEVKHQLMIKVKKWEKEESKRPS